MRFSSRETRDLWKAGIFISLAFAILLAGGLRGILALNASFIFIFGIAFATAGLGFLLHELMHKIVAQRYGLRAEFHAFMPMLWLALLLSFFGFIFAAPGAVFISGLVTRERNGKISVAGPLTNIALALLFLLLFFVSSDGLLHATAAYGWSINALLAAFNMIPVMPLDGAKVLAWHKGVYAATMVLALVLYLATFFT